MFSKVKEQSLNNIVFSYKLVISIHQISVKIYIRTSELLSFLFFGWVWLLFLLSLPNKTDLIPCVFLCCCCFAQGHSALERLCPFVQNQYFRLRFCSYPKITLAMGFLSNMLLLGFCVFHQRIPLVTIRHHFTYYFCDFIPSPSLYLNDLYSLAASLAALSQPSVHYLGCYRRSVINESILEGIYCIWG